MLQAKISSLKETIEALQARCHDLEARVQHAQDREAELAGELCIRDEQNLHLEQRAQAQAQQISREQEKLEQCRLENAAMVEMHTKEVKRWQEQMSVRIQERDLALASLQASQASIHPVKISWALIMSQGMCFMWSCDKLQTDRLV